VLDSKSARWLLKKKSGKKGKEWGRGIGNSKGIHVEKGGNCRDTILAKNYLFQGRPEKLTGGLNLPYGKEEGENF